MRRRPGEAVGSICRLVSADRELTLNVEYNQLDSLLKVSFTFNDYKFAYGMDLCE